MKYKFLNNIDSPSDLKKLSIDQLPQLAEETRDYIVNVVSRTGGHLASSLGAVELALAIHYVFDSPRDKIIWDVGHQAYPHKILTGRREAFATNRCWEGLSGFPQREESPHDAFGTGHASTSISAGFGLVCARDLMKQKHQVISVIGDGSLTGGLAFEGLNNAGASGKNFIVILNDNMMSISPNVGALHNYLTLLMTHPAVSKMKDDLWDMTGKLPSGELLQRVVGRVDTGLKSIVAPGLLFERLGFRFLGPADGHNIESLVKILRHVKNLKGPQFLHVITQKGKGYKFAEEDATRFHGLGSFDKTTGVSNGSARNIPTYTFVFGKALTELADQDPKIVGITAAMAEGTGMVYLQDEFPDRFFDVGIAEGHAVTFAAGLATQGFKPVVAVYSTFLQRAFDEIVHDVALQKLNVVFAIDRAGVVGEDGPTHHGCLDLSYLRQIPNMSIMAPRNEAELRDMLFTAIQHTGGPVAIRYPRGTGVGVPLKTGFRTIPFGKGEILRRGEDIAVLAVGPVVHECSSALDMLSSMGIHPTLVDMKFVKPLDTELLLEIARNHRLIITIEENTIEGGFGSLALEKLSILDDPPKVLRMGIPDKFIVQGPRKQLLKYLGLTADSIVNAVEKFAHKEQVS